MTRVSMKPRVPDAFRAHEEIVHRRRDSDDPAGQTRVGKLVSLYNQRQAKQWQWQQSTKVKFNLIGLMPMEFADCSSLTSR
jgi:hypothetical protein